MCVKYKVTFLQQYMIHISIINQFKYTSSLNSLNSKIFIIVFMK